MRIPSLKYFFEFRRYKWVLMSWMKKFLEKNGETINKPLTKLEMFTITKRVVNSYPCFEQGYCSKCKCDMVDAINMKTYECAHGCFSASMDQEEFDEYNKNIRNEFINNTFKR